MIPAKIKKSNSMQQFKRHWTLNACLIKFNRSHICQIGIKEWIEYQRISCNPPEVFSSNWSEGFHLQLHMLNHLLPNIVYLFVKNIFSRLFSIFSISFLGKNFIFSRENSLRGNWVTGNSPQCARWKKISRKKCVRYIIFSCRL